ncbi:RraA family protein [Rhodovarius crocodyli]|uniref:Putative 4-hydroxy-4-methyl-2-oxoglutarate aldolase n=1 Tax=Rhodovarius crocodyli TaxID=1979269 RepID=A0A437LX91_9PROT|nr:RraA family protein [Rhodovarius crocodyli]RVT90011.1 RraA family protein [Rhodovarius crocodyli]
MPVGFAIHQRTRAVSPEIVEAFRPLPVANISDCMSRITAGGPRIRPMHKGGVMAGPALTIKTRPGDNLMIHKAIQLAVAGDVLVVDGGGDLTNALIGELMANQMIMRKLGGIVLNGAIRDAGWIGAHDFPVYAAGVTHRGPYKDGPGVINGAIAIDGMVIEPGDLIIGDEDGFLCVPYADLDVVLKASQAKKAAEDKQMAAILGGTHSAPWVDETLRKAGVEGI